MKWFRRKKKSDEDPEEGAVQEATPEQADEEPGEDEAENLEQESVAVEPRKRSFWGGIGKKKADTVPEDTPEQEPLPEPLEAPPEPDEAEELDEEPVPEEEPRRGFFGRLRKKKSKKNQQKKSCPRKGFFSGSRIACPRRGKFSQPALTHWYSEKGRSTKSYSKSLRRSSSPRISGYKPPWPLLTMSERALREKT
jgi:hypothetical protein